MVRLELAAFVNARTTGPFPDAPKPMVQTQCKGNSETANPTSHHEVWWSAEYHALCKRFGHDVRRYVTRPDGGSLLELKLQASLTNACVQTVNLIAIVPANYPMVRPIIAAVDRHGSVDKGMMERLGSCVAQAINRAAQGPAVLFAMECAVALIDGQTSGSDEVVDAKVELASRDCGRPQTPERRPSTFNINGWAARRRQRPTRPKTRPSTVLPTQPSTSTCCSSTASDIIDSSSGPSEDSDSSTDCGDLDMEMQNIMTELTVNIHHHLSSQKKVASRSSGSNRKHSSRYLPPVPPLPQA